MVRCANPSLPLPPPSLPHDRNTHWVMRLQTVELAMTHSPAKQPSCGQLSDTGREFLTPERGGERDREMSRYLSEVYSWLTCSVHAQPSVLCAQIGVHPVSPSVSHSASPSPDGGQSSLVRISCTASAPTPLPPAVMILCRVHLTPSVINNAAILLL